MVNPAVRPSIASACFIQNSAFIIHRSAWFKEEPVMKHMEKDLQTLVCRGKNQGYLTYDDVSAYLPDQDVTPEKLDNLLVALEAIGIELVDKAPLKPGQPPLKTFPPVDDQPALIKPEE